MQQVITDRLTEIEKKVKQLASKMEQLQKLNVALKEENRKLKSSVAVLNQQAGQPSEAVNIAAFDHNKKDDGAEKRTKKLKKEIGQYLKEIDKCIDWLQNN